MGDRASRIGIPRMVPDSYIACLGNLLSVSDTLDYRNYALCGRPVARSRKYRINCKCLRRFHRRRTPGRSRIDRFIYGMRSSVGAYVLRMRICGKGSCLRNKKDASGNQVMVYR